MRHESPAIPVRIPVDYVRGGGDGAFVAGLPASGVGCGASGDMVVEKEVNRMPKIKQREGCIKCGRTDRWMLGVTAQDKQGKKVMVGICFSCMAKQAEEKMVSGYGEALRGEQE